MAQAKPSAPGVRPGDLGGLSVRLEARPCPLRSLYGKTYRRRVLVRSAQDETSSVNPLFTPDFAKAFEGALNRQGEGASSTGTPAAQEEERYFDLLTCMLGWLPTTNSCQ